MDENQKPKEPADQPAQQEPVSQNPQPVKPVATHQGAAMANGQPYSPQPTHGSSFNQSSPKKSKWRYLFMVLGALQVLGVFIFISTLFSVSGQTGSEFVALYLFLTLVPLITIAAFINVIGLPIYIVKQNLKGKALVFAILSLAISLFLLAYGVYNQYQIRVQAPNYFKEQLNNYKSKNAISNSEILAKAQSCKIKSIIILQSGGDYPAILNIKNQDRTVNVSKDDLPVAQKATQDNVQKCGNVPTLYENDSGGGDIITAISLDEAKKLLDDCKVDQVRMPKDQKYNSKAEQKALDETGIYRMDSFDGVSFGIGFNDSKSSELTPIARDAGLNCRGIRYMYEPGNWVDSI